MTQEERIEQMEALFDKSNEVLEQLKQSVGAFLSIQPTIEELANYYRSDWRTDFEADEKGKLSAGLKRGVLSEDGLWELLEEYQRLKDSLEDQV